MNCNNGGASYDAIYFDSFGNEHFLKEIKIFIENKSIITNIYRMHAYNLTMYGYFCTEFIDFILKNKSLLDYINIFSANDYEKNDKIIVKYFQ